jgi:phage baseplate assembly protein W
MALDFTDFYILYQGHPKYTNGEVIEDEVISVIVQKLEVMLFTNKGSVLGEPNFGISLEELLYQTRVSDTYVKNEIENQIAVYIRELLEITYSVNVVFAQDPLNYQDIMFINIKFADYDVYAQIGKFA